MDSCLCKSQSFAWSALKHHSSFSVKYCSEVGTEKLTADEVESMAAEVRNVLLRFNPGCVGLLLEYSISLPSIILGIIRAGHYFMSISDAVTYELLIYSLEKFDVSSLLTESSRLPSLKAVLSQYTEEEKVTVHGGLELVLLRKKIASSSYLCCKDPSDSWAYVMQTSGTTGPPRQVLVPFSCILPNVTDFVKLFNVNSDDVIFLASPFTFDPSVVDIFVAISTGACLLMVSEDLKTQPQKLADILFNQNNRVTIMQLTPTLFNCFPQQIILEKILGLNSSVRVLAFGGEPCPSPKLVLRRLKHPENRTRIFNLYGITEVSCWHYCCEITGDIWQFDEAPLGNLLSKTESQLEPVSSSGDVARDSSDEIFELFVGGAERRCLVGDENWQTAPVFRNTGDLVWYRTDGHLFFCGRSDAQVKRMGKRINLRQIGAIVEQVSCVVQCHVILHNFRLLAFVKVCKPGSVSVEELESWTRSRLPAHSCPDKFVFVENFQATRHGKVDTKKLLENYETELHDGQVSLNGRSKNHIKATIHHVIQEVLHLDSDLLSWDVNFSSLSGNDSLKAVQVVADLEWRFNCSFPQALQLLLSHTEKVFTLFDYVQETLNSTDDDMSLPGNATNETRGKTKTEMVDGDSKSPSSKRFKSLKTVTDSAIDALISVGKANNSTLHKNVLLRTTNNERFSFAAKVEETTNVSLVLQWKYDMKKCIDASPLIIAPSSLFSSGNNNDVDNNLNDDDLSSLVLIGSHSHRFVAVELLTGVEKWCLDLGDRIEASAVLSSCGRFVIVGTYSGTVYFIDWRYGKVSCEFAAKDAVKCSAALLPQSNSVIFGSHDKSLYCFDVCEQKLQWKCDLNGGVLSTPTVCNAKVFAATLAGTVYSVNTESGQIIGSCIVKPVFSSLVLLSENELLCGCVDGKLYFINTESMSISREFTASGPIFSTPSVINTDAGVRILLGAHCGFVYCLNVEATTVWKADTGCSISASPFAFQRSDSGGGGYCACAATNGTGFILELSTGKLIATQTFPGETFSSPVILNDRIIQGCRDNFLYCFKFVYE